MYLYEIYNNNIVIRKDTIIIETFTNNIFNLNKKR